MPSAIEAIGSASTSNSSWLEYTSIPATYDQLIIVILARRYGNDNTATGTNLAAQFRINGSWCTDHAQTNWNAYYTSASAQSDASDTEMFLARRFHAATYYNNNCTGGSAFAVLEVFNYHDNNSQTNDVIPYWKCQAMAPSPYKNDSSDGRMMRVAGGAVANNASTFVPIDGFRIKSDSGNLGSPTKFTIYGVKYD